MVSASFVRSNVVVSAAVALTAAAFHEHSAVWCAVPLATDAQAMILLGHAERMLFILEGGCTAEHGGEDAIVRVRADIPVGEILAEGSRAPEEMVEV